MTDEQDISLVSSDFFLMSIVQAVLKSLLEGIKKNAKKEGGDLIKGEEFEE